MSYSYQSSPSFLNSLSRVWQKSYAGDYIGLIVLLTANVFVMAHRDPFHRMFYLDDPRLAFPHAEVERVPVPMLLVLSVLTPLAVIVAWSLMQQKGKHFTHVSILALSTSVLMTNFLVDLIKNYVGSPRPDLVARCKPKKGTPLHQLVSIEVCTETEHHTLQDGFRSFPSGHTSTAFAGLFFLSIFMSGQLLIFQRGANLSKILLAGSGFIMALMISMSRLQDYRHDYYDVCAGGIIGTFIAYYAYRRYFPSLWTDHADIPYPDKGGNVEYREINTRNDVEMARV